MKKNGFLIALFGLFLIFGGNLIIKEKTRETYFLNTLDSPILSNKVIYREYHSKINKISETLNRDEYNLVMTGIDSLNDNLTKISLLKETFILDAKIKDEEERLLKYTSIENLRGKVSAFTPYCSDGCNGYTASGRYVGNDIYYNDKDYGKVMIVAADKSYPFGTIVRFNNLKYFGNEVFAIVLDRGGAVGKGKRVLFDLLFASEKSANNFGIAKDVSCDILRLGY